MPSTLPKLSDGEFDLLKILWRLDSATVAQVRDAHDGKRGHKPAYTTTMTILGRLVEKGAVRVFRDKQPYRYKPAIRRSTLLRKMLNDFVERCFEGEVEYLVEQLVSEGLLGSEELMRKAVELDNGE